jgi:hypothetical protein
MSRSFGEADVAHYLPHGRVANHQEVTASMTEILPAIAQSRMPQFVGFWGLYTNVSLDMGHEIEVSRAGVKKPPLTMPDQVDEAMTWFLEEVVDDLRYLYSGDHDKISKSWATLFLSPEAQQSAQGVWTAVGINNHVSSGDLAHSVYMSGAPDDYWHDYNRGVNKVLGKRALLTVPEMMPKSNRLSQVTAAKVGSQRIAHDRTSAWKLRNRLIQAGDDDELKTQLLADQDKKIARQNERVLQIGNRAISAVRCLPNSRRTITSPRQLN